MNSTSKGPTKRYRFSNSRWKSSKKKREIFNDWVSFINNDFDYEFLTPSLAEHLAVGCRISDYYSPRLRAKLHRNYFLNPVGAQKILDHFDRDKGCPNIIDEFRQSWEPIAKWTDHGRRSSDYYYDLNRAMIAVIAPALSALRKKMLKTELEQAENELKEAKKKIKDVKERINK